MFGIGSSWTIRPSSASTTARKSGASTPVPSCRQATYMNSSGGACSASCGEWWNDAGLSCSCCIEAPFCRPSLALLEERRDQARDSGGAVGLDRRAEPVEHERGQPFRRRAVVGRRVGCAVAAQSVDDVVVLLEVVAKRDGDERTAVGDELHRRRETALHDGEVAARERAEEIVDVADRLHALDGRDRRRVDPWTADELEPCLGHVLAQLG